MTLSRLQARLLCVTAYQACSEVAFNFVKLSVSVGGQVAQRLRMDKLPRPYRPGKAPVFAANDDDEESPFSRAPEVKKKSASSSSSQVVAEVVMAPAPEKADRRLNRIREPVDRSEALVERHRRHHDTVAEIVAVPVVEEPKRPEPQAPIATTPAAVPEAEEDPEARRERIRRQMKEQEQQEELPVAEEQEEESEYEEEEASDDEGAGGITALPPPLFVPKAARETIAERDRLQKEEEEREAARLKGLEDRKGESRNMLIEAIKKDKEEEQAAQSDAEPENEGELDEAKEIELWKIRELKRIKREREERDQKEREKEEIEKRRGLTDAQVSELDKDRLKPKEKEKWKFLQKYYHRGAFFGDDAILTRDFSAPTGEDHANKEILPAVMQVKKFGKMGRTKWTHLTAEDTTAFDQGWGAKDNPVWNKVKQKLAGVRPIVDERSAKKHRGEQR